MNELFRWFILLFGIFLLITIMSCSPIDGNITKAPSGLRNVDVSGKSFEKIDQPASWTIETTTVTHSSNGTSNTTQSIIILATKKTTITFNSDGTFSKVEEDIFTDGFSGNLEYYPLYKEISAGGSETTTNYDIYAVISPVVDAVIYANYKAKSDTSYQKFERSYNFTGFSGQVFKAVEETGTWSKREIPTDGFTDITVFYFLDIDLIKTTIYSVGPVALNYIIIEFEGSTPTPYDVNEPALRFTEAYNPDFKLTTTENDIANEFRLDISADKDEDDAGLFIIDGEYYQRK